MFGSAVIAVVRSASEYKSNLTRSHWVKSTENIALIPGAAAENTSENVPEAYKGYTSCKNMEEVLIYSIPQITFIVTNFESTFPPTPETTMYRL